MPARSALLPAPRVLVAGAAALLLLSLLVLVNLKGVTLTVDGDTRTLNTMAATVGDVLDEAGVTWDHQDLVTPPVSTMVEEGTHIIVLHAVTVTVFVDGELTTITAPVTTVGEVLRKAGVPTDAWVSVPVRAAVADLDVVLVRLPTTVTVTVDGEVLEVDTLAQTVGRLLDEIGVTVGSDDVVEPATTALLDEETAIVVRRVTHDQVVTEVAIAYETIRRETDQLYRGSSRVVQAGANGLRVDTYRVRYVDGTETGRELVSQEIRREPTPRIVEVGTKELPPGVNGRQTGDATYYGCGDGFHGRRTASGEIFDENKMTAAHLSLPFGTIVTVTNNRTGATVQVRINDRGPAAWTGKIIDLSCAAMKAVNGGTLAGSLPVVITW